MANRRYIDFPIASSVGDSDIILIWQSGANKQTTKATFLSGLPENLDELNDVAISGLTNGQILRYDSVTGKWENTDQGNLDLNDLNDVSIVSPSNGQVLVYNSSTSRWENSSGGYVPYTGAVTTVNLGAQTIQAGSFVKAGGTSAQFLKADGSVDSNVYGTGTVTSVALTMPSAFSVANSPITTAGTLAVTGAGTVGQYIRGDGSLADFPESSGGGSSVSYYLNGSVAQGTIGGVAYKELNKVPILGAGTDFTINADGYIASFLTDAGDPNLLEIPGGNWNFETYFSASSSGGTPTFYVELYKVNSGGTATLIASNSGFPELIAFGTNIISYFSTLAVPTTALALTDRLAIRYYVTHSGRTITLHTEDNHLCQIITTFTTGLTALNGLTAQIQNFAVGTSGTDFAIASATATHTFNLPTASATNRGALSSADWTTFNSKQNALTNPVTGTGASGQVAYFTGTTAISSESNLFWDATNDRLGINTSNPLASLQVGNGTQTAINEAGNKIHIATNSTRSALVTLANSSGGATVEGIFESSAESADLRVIIGATSNHAVILRSNNTEAMRIFTSRNVHIGSTPSSDNGARLQVSGTATVSSTLTANYGGVFVIPVESPATGNVALIARTSNGANDIFRWFDGSTQLGVFKNNGNVIIGGNVDNGAKLQVKVSTDRNLAIKFDSQITISSQSDTGAPESIRNYADTFRIFTATTAAGLTERLAVTNTGNVEIYTGKILRLYRADNTRALEIYSTNNECVINSWEATSEPLHLRSMGSQGRIQFFTNSTEQIRIVPNGNFLVGTQTDSGQKMQVYSSGTTRIRIDAGGNNTGVLLAESGTSQWSLASAGTTLLFYNELTGNTRFSLTSTGAATFNSLGTGTVTATAGLLSTVSDSSYKIEDGFIDSAIDKILSLKPRYFYWNEKSGLPTDIRQLGFYAQEVNQALGEEAANTPQNENTPWGISDRSIIAMLTKAIQELKQEIDTLKN